MFNARKIMFATLFFLWIYLVYQIRVADNFADNIRDVVAYKILGVLFFVMLQAVFAAMFLPCSLFTVIAGSVWGVEYGIIVSTVATVFASTLTYTISRRANAEQLDRIVRHIPKGVINLTVEKPFVSSLLFHLNPLFPGSISGYIFGLKRIRFAKYVSGCFIGTLPLQVLLVFLGNGLAR